MRLFPSSLLLCLLLAIAGHGQVIGANKDPQQADTYTLNVRSQLAIETVEVRDKQGQPVPNLTAKDFTLTEDGAPQQIRHFERQVMSIASKPLTASRSEDEKITIYKKLNRSSIASEKAEQPRYTNRRLLAMYFDMTAMQPGDQLRALGAAEKFVRTQMTSADLVSVLRYTGGAVDVLQDFTADRDRLLSILETLVVGEGQGEQYSNQDASAADNGAAFGQDDSEFNIFNTDRQLSALQTAASLLGQLKEKKMLLYFASGLRLNGVDNQAQLRATVDAAVRADVAFWPIDARGLVAEAPMGDATQGSPGNEGMYSGAATQAVNNDLQQSQDTLFALAGDTGGKVFLDNNDLARGIVAAQRSVGDYYILAYYTTNPALDGRFRRIKISVDAIAEVKLEYRQGYYAGKDFHKFATADKERQLEEALMLEDPITELTVAVEMNYFQINRAEYFVPMVIKIPGRELALAQKGGAKHTLIDFVGEIKDAYGGSTVTNLRDNVNIRLTETTAVALTHQPIEYDAGFTLLPGKYIIKLLARDDETGRIGTYQTTFTIPNLNDETTHVPISSVVLSGQKLDIRDAVYDAQKAKQQAKENSLDPLISNGLKLVPSVTRVFSRTRPIYVYLQAYESAGTPVRPMVAYVTFYREGKKQLEARPVATTPPGTERLTPVPLNFSLDVHTLTPGDYDCQVSVLDPADGKSTFWRTAIRVTQ